MFFFFFRRVNASNRRRPALKVRKFVRRLPLCLEVLEDRIMLSQDIWQGGSGNWDVGGNWSLGSAPGTGDTALISTASAATITIQSGDTIKVESVTTSSNDTLSITGGSLTVTTGSSTLSGALSMSGGSVTATGSGVNLTANGSTTNTGASLYAQAGAVLDLPQLTSYTANGGNTTFQASGTHSVLDASNLTTVNLDDGDWSIEATKGGTLNLSNVSPLSDGSFNGDIFLTDTGGSHLLLNSSLTSLNAFSVTLDGTDTQVASSWTKLTGGALTVTGGSVSLPSLTDVDFSSLFAESGGSLALPGLTSYSGGYYTGYSTEANEFYAEGSGSVLDVSALTTLEQGSTWDVDATDDGTIKMSSALTGFSAASDTMATSDGGTLTFGTATVTMPSSGNGVTITVPQLPQGIVINLDDSYPSAFTGGTIFNISAGDTVNIGVVASGSPLPPSSFGATFSGGTVFNVGQGSNVFLAGETFLGGTTFNVAQGATVDLSSYDDINTTYGNTALGGPINTTYGGTLTGTGAGTVLFSGDYLTPALGGLTLNFPGNMFQWTGGIFLAAQGDVTNQGTMNLAGYNDKILDEGGTLFNYGTIIQTGSGNLSLHVNTATFVNEAGAYYLIESDSGIDSYEQVAVQNAGTIRKTTGTGTSDLSINGSLSNTGTIEADSGTLYLDANSISQVAGNTLTAGTWNALNGAALIFPLGTNIITNQANVRLDGGGASMSALFGLTANSGSFSLTNGANFTTTGSFTNTGSLTIGSGSTLIVSGSYTQTSAGAFNVQIGGTPASGQFGQVVAEHTANLDGTMNVSLVNGFTPSSGQDFEVMMFDSGASGTFSTVSGLGTALTEQLNAISLDLVGTGPSLADLGLTSVTAPTTATTGQQITVSWQVTNSGSTAASGSWQDSVYLSTTPTITSSSILLGSVTHSGGLAATDSYNASLSTAVPAVPPGNYYVLVQADSLYQVPVSSRANDILAANTGQLAVSVPALTLGTPLQGTFTAADQDQYYQVTVPAGGSLQVSLTSAATSGALALYVSQDTLPTPYNYQESANLAGDPNQSLNVPVTAAGTYYILVHSVSGAAATAGYTLIGTQTNALSVSSISSDSGGNAGNVTIEIDGTNFTPQTTASLTLGTTVLQATAVDFVSGTQLFATFNLSGAAVGGYTLSVQQGTQSATAPTPFQVVAANTTPLSVTLSVPEYVRSGRTGTITINYTNESNNDIVAPLLEITDTNPDVSFSTPDDPNVFVQEADVLAVAPSGPAGILRPGQSGTLTLTLLSEDPTDGDSLPVQVSQIQAGQTVDWSSQEADLQPDTVPTAAWNVIWSNLMAMVGTTTDSYNAALAQAATYLGGLGETTADVSDVSRLWSFLVSQADASYPTPVLTSAVDASLPTADGSSLDIDRIFQSTISGRYTPGIFGLGWTTFWQTSLSVDSSGDVTIDMGGTFLSFVTQPNGSYLDLSAERGSLSQSGGLYTYTDATGNQYAFGANGNLNYVQDNNGNLITLGYNDQNQLVTLTYSNPADPSLPSSQLTLEYNAQGFVTQVADGTGNTWSYTYDSAGHLLSVTAPGNLTTTYTYDTGSDPETANALLSITNCDGSQDNYTYDPITGRLTGTYQNGGANSVTFAYPGEGEVMATDAAGDTTTIWFNDLGQDARDEDPLGNISTAVFDDDGNLVSATDAAGGTYQYSYDTNGNLTQFVNPLGQTTQMTYGPLDTMTSMTDADGNKTQYGYGSTGNLLSITYPDGTQQSFTYDPLGNLSESIEQNGDPISYQYNAQGLVSQESFADGTSQTYTYDVHGNMLTASTYDSGGTLTGTTTLTYNTADELTSITYPGDLSLTFTYNAAGQRTQSVDQSGYTINYRYDSLGRLSELTDGSGNLIVQYTYNNVGELVKKVNGNGTYTTYTYDADGNLTQEINYANSSGTTVNSLFTYTYNALGEQTSVTDVSGNVTSYVYDAIGQLTQVTLPNGTSITYVYNAAGDRTEVVTNGTATNYTSNTDNEITQVGSTTYTYDANGNLVTATDASGTTTYTYNDLNQLVSITNPDGSVQGFQYSPLGFMVGTSTTSGGTTTQTSYLVDPTGIGNVVAAYNGSGALIADYTYGLGLVMQTGPSGTGYYDFDASGNTVGMTGSSGSYVNQYSYLPFGETTTTSAILPNPFTFAGQFGVMQIGTDLFNMRARNYTPATGQFLSNDPLGLAGGDFNTRTFVSNSPVSLVDPLGLKPFGAQDNNGQWWIYDLNDKLPNGQPACSLLQPGWDAATDANITVFRQGQAAALNGQIDPGEIAHEQQHVDDFYQYGAPSTNYDYDWREIRAYQEGMKYARSPAVYRAQAQGLECFKRKYQYDKKHPKKIPVTAPLSTIGPKGKNDLDPNALIGPDGYGTQDFIQPAGNWSYTIDFENDGSVAAQDVTVTEQLDPNLDWSTFQLGSFGFGPVVVTVPTGLTQYQAVIPYENVDGTSLNVEVRINFNVQTGLLTVTFTSLDPLTGQAPTGVFDGFLPPNDSSGVGEGYVQYTVQPKSGLTSGTTINQQASVVFDTNAAIQTNTVTNTIDATPPTSSVNPLPPTVTSPSFTVSWSGSDANGPGIASYTIYVSDNGGAFTPWLTNTTQTSATYTGQVGHTYGFYSVATDPLGLTQPTPSAAQASTHVTSISTTTTTAVSTTKPFSTNTQYVTLTANVTSPAGTVNEGTVTFTLMRGNTVFGTATTSTTVKNGEAMVSYLLPANLPPTTYLIDASYSDNGGNFQLSSNSNQSPMPVLTVLGVPTTITASSVATTFSTSGQSVTLTAQVGSSSGPVTGGTVTFELLQGSSVIGTATTSVTVRGGQVSVGYVLPAKLPAGGYTINAVYNPGFSFAASADTSQRPLPILIVAPAATTITANSATIPSSRGTQTITLTAHVTSAAGIVNEGTVTFTILLGSTVIGTATTSTTVLNGQASVNYVLPANLPVGFYTIEAVYNPGSDFRASSDIRHMLYVSSVA